jgi:hypothetical protein
VPNWLGGHYVRGEKMVLFDTFDIRVVSTDVGKLFIKELFALLEEMKPCLLDKEKAKIEITVEKGRECISVILPHKENGKFSLSIDFGDRESIVYFADSHFHLDGHDDKERIDDIINILAKIMGSLIEVHTFYKGKKLINTKSYFVSKSVDLELFQDSIFTFNYLLYLNPFLKKWKNIEQVQFSC